MTSTVGARSQPQPLLGIGGAEDPASIFYSGKISPLGTKLEADAAIPTPRGRATGT